MTTESEPMPPEARKAIRLAIATHLLHSLISGESIMSDVTKDKHVDEAYSLADKLLERNGL